MVGLLTLSDLGWNEYYSSQLKSEDDKRLQPARVITIHKGACEVSNGRGVCLAKMTGRLRYNAKSKADFPTVGDWVLVKDFSVGEFGRIERVLNRKSILQRKSVGRASRKQLIAANIDRAFIIQGLDTTINLNRIERYLVMVHEGNIQPVIILTKSDLLKPEQCDELLSQVKGHFKSTKIILLSNKTNKGLVDVMSLFESGITCCVIGMSGVGKTTLINKVLGEDRFITMPVRASDGKGMHTTTWRELITLQNGGHVIDTPGLRELGSLDVEKGIEEAFDDIQIIAVNCKFKDCSHIDTEGCAVIDAVKEGRLSKARYENYIKLVSEAAQFSKDLIENKDLDRQLARFHRTLKNKE